MDTEISLFDISNIANDLINIIGKRDSGKTTLINDILKVCDNKKQALIMCNICDNYNYDEINFEFDKEKLCLLLNKQNENDIEKAVVVLDNVINSTNKNDIRELYHKNKYYNVLSINSYTDTALFKHNADYTFIFNVNNYPEKQRLYNDYFYKFFIEYKIFDDLFSSLNPYECFVIKNDSRPCLYRYKVNLAVKYIDIDCIR